MAASPSPLVWDFYRTISGVEALGGVVHYFDENSQTLYLKNGDICTKTAKISNGNWQGATLSSEIDITDDSFTKLRFDHPSTGVVYGVATDSANLIFLKYAYSLDISDVVTSFTWSSSTDNAISDLSLNIQNIRTDLFGDAASLVNPGAKIPISIRVGDSEPYPIGLAWLDEVDYSETNEEVSISGRNTIGYFLKDQTFDDVVTYSGETSTVIANIMAFAGITTHHILPTEGEEESRDYEFKSSDTLMSGLESICDTLTTAYGTTETGDYKFVETPTGQIIFGFDDTRSTYLPNSKYTFQAGRDVFSRSSRKAADAAYTQIRVTGTDANKEDLDPVTVSVTSFNYWSLGAHRTKHLTAPDGMTQSEMQTWAEEQAEILQYTGITEDFTGPFRPQLVAGDVAEIQDGSATTSLGIITEVRQTFSRDNGFKTEFSVDSGGKTTEGEGYIIYTRSSQLHGYNRKQTITDLIKSIASNKK